MRSGDAPSSRAFRASDGLPSGRARASRRAFSLIELLLVAAILSILSSIAVVNYSEAGTRARAAAARSDMRTLATALESYRVDFDDYPENLAVPPGVVAGTSPPRAPGFGVNVVPPSITTPIAYLTLRPLDPFRSGVSGLYDHPAHESFAARGYSYYRTLHPAEWLDLLDRGRMISFIALDRDPAVPGPGNAAAFRKYGDWVVWSAGPDGVLWRAREDFLVPGNLASPLLEPTAAPWGHGFDIPYDPTNGVVSFGNLIRTQFGDSRPANPHDDPRATSDDAPDRTPPSDPDPPDAPAESPEPTPPPPAPSPAPSVPPDDPSAPDGSAEPNPAEARAGGGAAIALAGGGIVSAGAPVAGAFGGGRRGGSSSRDADGATATAASTPAPHVGGAESETISPEARIDRFARELAATADEDDDFVLREPGYPMARRLSLLLIALAIALLMLWVVLRTLRRPEPAESLESAPHLSLDDAALAGLPASREVRALHLANPGVTDSGLEHLAKFAATERLNLASACVTDAGMGRLAGLTGLRELSLAGTAVGDAGLGRLRGLRLEELDLSATRVTDAGLDVLERMKTLRRLDVRGTAVTAGRLEELRMALPNCEFLADGPPA